MVITLSVWYTALRATTRLKRLGAMVVNTQKKAFSLEKTRNRFDSTPAFATRKQSSESPRFYGVQPNPGWGGGEMIAPDQASGGIWPCTTNNLPGVG